MLQQVIKSKKLLILYLNLAIRYMKEKGLHPKLLNQAYTNKWFKLFVKKEFGGAELSLSLAMIELFKASELDGSLGWCVNLGSGASYFSGFMNKDAVIELLSEEKSAFAGSGEIGEATRIKDKYSISGKWSRCTGSDHATAFTVNAMLSDGVQKSFVIPKQKVKTINDWTMMGLKRSSTHQLNIEKALIPIGYGFEIGQLNPETSYAVHNIPFETFARGCMIASLLGIAQKLINEVNMDADINSKKGVLAATIELEKEVNFYNRDALSIVKQIEEHIRLEKEIYDYSEQLKEEVIDAAKRISKKAHLVYYACGLRAADEKTPFNITFRDLLVAGQHPLFR